MDLIKKEQAVAGQVEQKTAAATAEVAKGKRAVTVRLQAALAKVEVLEAHLMQAMDGYSKLVHYDISRTKTFIDEIKTHLKGAK